MKGVVDITIVGAGIVGAATAYRLREKWPDAQMLVLEKEPAPATHQTGRNSGVIHSGIYYKPGSLKAELCRTGREMLYAFALAEDLPHERCGKIILAVEEEEVPRFSLGGKKIKFRASPGSTKRIFRIMSLMHGAKPPSMCP
jgi:L-2-hydroxyglutarate oxidase